MTKRIPIVVGCGLAFKGDWFTVSPNGVYSSLLICGDVARRLPGFSRRYYKCTLVVSNRWMRKSKQFYVRRRVVDEVWSWGSTRYLQDRVMYSAMVTVMNSLFPTDLGGRARSVWVRIERNQTKKGKGAK